MLRIQERNNDADVTHDESINNDFLTQRIIDVRTSGKGSDYAQLIS